MIEINRLIKMFCLVMSLSLTLYIRATETISSTCFAAFNEIELMLCWYSLILMQSVHSFTVSVYGERDESVQLSD